MKVIGVTFDALSESAQFSSDTAIHAFHEEGVVEFKGYCMINSLAEPFGIELEQVKENEYTLHVLTRCEMEAMSERCILVSGTLSCGEVNHSLRIAVSQKMVDD